MFKRLMAVLLSAFLIMPVSGGRVSALGTAAGKAQESLAFLADLGIASSEIGDLDALMSREEFAVYMTNMFKLDTGSSANVRYFRDVEPDGYAVASINTLAALGLISVGDDRRFRPQDGILAEEAAKILVAALGYTEEAAQGGGYPVGYMSVALRLGILRSVDMSDNAVTYGKAFTMMCNAMEAPLLSIEILMADGTALVYDSDKELNVLSQVWGLASVRGMVTAVYGRSVSDAVIRGENEIRIDDVLYRLSDGLSAGALFGSYVKAYYEENIDRDERLILSVKSAEKIEDVSIRADDFRTISGNEISYYNENGREQKVVLTEPVYVYNGYPLRSDILNRLSSMNKGEIVIKDGNGDGNYDIAIISDYENFVVSAADAESAYSRLGGAPIVWADYRSVRIATADGIRLTPADIKAGQNLAVARSEGGYYIEAVVSDTTVTGNIEACEMVGDVYYVTVASKSYPVEKSYAAVVKDTYLTNVSFADSYDFLIDPFGNIAYMVKRASAMQTGYIVDGGIDANTLSPVASLKVLTEQNKFEIYDLADNVKINESRYKSSVAAYENLPGNTAVSNQITVQNQLIRYTLNNDGEINYIATASPTAWNGTDDAGFLQLLERDTEHRYVRGRMGQKITLSDSSLVFFLPRGVTELEEEDCGVTNYNILIDDMTYLTNAYVFAEDGIVADAAVVFYTSDQIANNRLYTKPIMMVSGISQVLDADGNPQHCVTGYSNGGKIEYYVPGDISVDGIEEGDIVMFTFDYRGNIIEGADGQDYEMLVKRSDIEANGRPTWTNHERYDYLWRNSSDAISDYYRSDLQLSFGYVTRTNENAIAFDHEFDGIYDETVLYTGNVMVYDRSRTKDRVYTATVADILTYEAAGSDCAKIILRTRGQVPLEVFIYQ